MVIFLTEHKKREPKAEKVQVVEDFTKRVQSAKSAVITGYTGLTVEEVTDLRAKLFHAKVEYHVVKNNLARIALNKCNITVLDDLLTGPTAIALAMEDAVAPARVLSKFAKDHDKLSVKGGWMEGTQDHRSGHQGLGEFAEPRGTAGESLGQHEVAYFRHRSGFGWSGSQTGLCPQCRRSGEGKNSLILLTFFGLCGRIQEN